MRRRPAPALPWKQETRSFSRAVNDKTSGLSALNTAAADVNNDGKTDLVVALEAYPSGDSGIGGVAVLLGNGDGSFQRGVGQASGGRDVHGVGVAHLNRDGS